jgi:polysaccharide biosynthesis protein PelD
MVDEILGPKKFSVYSFSPSGFEAMVGQGWEEKDKYLRRFLPDSSLFETITSRKGIVCVINEKDEAVLSGEGVLATPIIDTESGNIYGMLKIEEIDFAELNISSLELAQTFAELVGAAYSNAQSYSRLERRSIYSSTQEDSYSFSLFQTHKKLLGDILSRARQDLTQIDIKVEPRQGRPDKDFFSRRSSLIRILNGVLLEYETLYQMGKGEMHYTALLPLTSIEEAEQRTRQIEKEIEKDDFLSVQKVTIKAEKAV